MIHKFEKEFFKICNEIIAENKSIEEWAEIESDDQFQSVIYEGGFDGTEMEFCFSVYIEKQEYWFQLPLKSIHEIHNNNIIEIEIIEANI